MTIHSISFRFKGKDITFEPPKFSNRPDLILVDGTPYSMTHHADLHGWNWESSSRGNVLAFSSHVDGRGIFIEQHRFVEAMRSWGAG